MAAAPALSAGVLQEEEDVLVNVNLVDKERAEKNVELRKKKPDYLPYAEDESVDDLAQAGGQQRGSHEMLALALQEPGWVPICTFCLVAKTPLYIVQVRRGARGRAATVLPSGPGWHGRWPPGTGAGGDPGQAAAAGPVPEHGGTPTCLRVPHARGDGEPPGLHLCLYLG